MNGGRHSVPNDNVCSPTVSRQEEQVWGQQPWSAKCPVAARQVHGDEAGLRSSWGVRSAGSGWDQQGTGPGTVLPQCRLGRNRGKGPSVNAAPKPWRVKGTPVMRQHHSRADFNRQVKPYMRGGRACGAQWYAQGPDPCFICSTNLAKKF